MVGLSMDRDPRLVRINQMREHRMRALICGATLLGFLAVAGWASGYAGSQDDEKPTIKQIMAKLHKGTKAPLKAVQAQLKGGSPDWSKVETEAKVIEKFGTLLARSEAPRGEQASFEKLARSYEKNAKALKEAADNQELAKAKEATKKLGGSCKSCHDAHKPQ
jgi:cytochrome c556